MQTNNHYTIEKILDLEYQIDVSIEWLKHINFITQRDNPIIEEVLKQLWSNYQIYVTLIPNNHFQHQIFDIYRHLDCKHYPKLAGIKKLIVDKDTSNAMLNIANTANKIRVDTNVSMGLVRYFVPFTKHLPHNLSYWKITAETLGTLGICIPFTSILLVAYQLLQKLQLEQSNPNSLEFLYLYHQKKYTIYKNFLVILLNLSHFIVNYYQLFEVRFYFSFLSVCIDYLFYLIDYDEMNERLHCKETELYIRLIEKVPHLKNPHQLLHEDKISQLMALYHHYPELQLHIIELIINHQKQLRTHDGFILECLAMLFMLTSMIIFQQTGLVDPTYMLLIGLISSYFYNVLKAYVIDFIIDYRHQETIVLTGPNQEALAIKLGKLHNSELSTPSAVQSYTFYSLLAKTIVPLIAISLANTLTPTTILILLALINSLISLLEEFCKNNHEENLSITPA